MTSIQYQYNRSGNTGGNGGAGGLSASNKQTTSIRGRTESPGLRSRYQRLTTASTQDSSDMFPPNKNSRNTPSRNLPERISANPIEQQRQYNNKVNSIASNYLNKTGLSSVNNNQLTPRRAFKVDDQEQMRLASSINKLKTPQQNVNHTYVNSKTRLSDLDNQSDNARSKPQKYLTTHSNLNQVSKNYNLEDNLNSLNLKSKNHQQTSGYNIITHEITNSHNGTLNENYTNNKVTMNRNMNDAPGSLLRAAQSNNISNGPSQFYPAQQQQQYSNSYKIPTIPSNSSVSSSSNSSTVNNQSPSHNYYNNNNSIKNSGTDNHELNNKGIVGLKNLGNTCFMNCVLQCLSNTKCLLEYCLTNSYQDDLNTTMSVMKGSLFNSYGSLMKQMWSGGSVVSLQDFKSQLARFAPRFVGYAQQDAEEFLYYLVKGLHEDVNLIKKRPSPFRFDEKAWDRMSDREKSQEHWSMNLRTDNSRISDMFVGQLKSTLKCTKCDYKSPTFELFWHLAVPIPSKLSSIRLDDCIKQFMVEEILDGDNKPTCSRCNEKRRCTKRYTIEKLPRILVIHLKRFLKVRYNNKINSNVDYPIESLDMSKYLSHNVDPSTSRPNSSVNNSNCIYDLYGISLHSGTESSGHYVAYCKHPYKKKWNYFNDSQVREISTSSLQDANAYILFYQLRS